MVVLIDVAGGYALDNVPDGVFTFTDKQMEVIGHKTVAVERE